jgi:adenosyl cobinamide kinase/adenosyl cobinamide phosphate guanylyltransferase
MGHVTFLVGGARSGKSALAVQIGRRQDGDVVFVATAEPFDDDLRRRIERHRAERPPWPTIEAPLDLADAIAGAPPAAPVIVDCLTVWVGNVLHRGGQPAIGEVVEALLRRAGPAVVVSNEVGMGIHPQGLLGRRFRDELGRVNQAVATIAGTSLLLVAGRAIPLRDPWELL